MAKMDEKEWLRVAIEEAKRFVAEDELWLKANPDSIAAQVQLASSRNHLMELEAKWSGHHA